MPIPTPFHPRTSQLCTSLLWKDWAGCFAVRSYDTSHEREYFAIRHAAALIDVSPLFKYDVSGPDAGAFLAWVLVRDPRKLAVGRVSYLCWCDDDGMVVDDGTVARLERDRYRLTAAEPAWAWMRDHASGFDVTIEDVTRRLGALALQGPSSRALLERLTAGAVRELEFFRVLSMQLAGVPVHISRTGYTGDLGYEIWVERERALDVWDAIFREGAAFRLEPAGLDALDVTRVEAGFIMNGVDYFSANHCLIDARKSSPDEIGLGWTLRLDREPFVGQAPLLRRRRRGPRRRLIGLEYDWDEYEARFADVGLPPQVPCGAWRDPVPVYDGGGRQVGRATSGAWSPTLKRNLALASVETAHAEPGTVLRIEATVEYRRTQVRVRVVPTPFFDPPRKRG